MTESGMKVVEDAGDSETLSPGQIISARKLLEENSFLKRKDLQPVQLVMLCQQQVIKFFRNYQSFSN